MIKVFSGIRPSGQLHLGNYLGAIKNWIDLQNEADKAIFAVVDYHGITTPYDPKTYQQQVVDVIMDYLAAGVDPKKSLLIRQSKVPQHTELAWLFNTITPVSWVDRLPTYREKVEQLRKYKDEAKRGRITGRFDLETFENAMRWENNTGLLTYPILMAADILIYKSNLVPVGEDQLAHIDLANEIAFRFNLMFCGRGKEKLFESIKPHIAEGARIMSLQDASKKM